MDVIRALFPGGTITGCPKIRCMEIIAELEGVSRGAYTADTAAPDETLALRAGAGIVADSVAALELAETRAKAEGMLRALGDRA